MKGDIEWFGSHSKLFDDIRLNSEKISKPDKIMKKMRHTNDKFWDQVFDFLGQEFSQKNEQLKKMGIKQVYSM